MLEVGRRRRVMDWVRRWRTKRGAHGYRSLFWSAPIACCVLDRDGTIVEANPTAAHLLRTERTALVGEPLTRVAQMPDPTELGRHLARCFDEGRRVISEMTFFVRGRGETLIEAASAPLAADGACLSLLHDVTPARRAERRAQLLARIGAALEIPLGVPPAVSEIARLTVPALANVCFVDLIGEDGRLERTEVVCQGPHATELTERVRRHDLEGGWRARRSEILAKRRAVFEPESPAQIGTALAMDLGVTASILVPLVAHDRVLGLLGFLRADAAGLPGEHYDRNDLDAAEQIAHCVALALDNARLYDATSRKLRTQDDALMRVAHDLRQPLGTIIGYASLARTSAPAHLSEPLETIHRTAKRMNRLVSDLLDATSIEAGHMTLERRPCDLVAVAHDVVDAFVPAAQAKHVALRCAESCDHVEAFADPERVSQVVSNLVDNAVKFTPAGGEVSVSVDTRPDGARVAVTDSGPGIPDELVPHVFERYWQAKETAHGGHGLGLSIAREIVVALHGRIGVETKLGHGSTFFFTLPQNV
jgi:PAS domain S-box-containing protein